jgi:hypothetical protein
VIDTLVICPISINIVVKHKDIKIMIDHNNGFFDVKLNAQNIFV